MFETITYTKENIARRLIKRCTELWGLDESHSDHFDPLVRLLVEACSVEFEKVGQEIQHTELRLMNRLAEILSPETHNGPQPATAIAQARPLEPTGWIDPDNQLVGKRINPRKGESAELYFSPAGRYPLVNANITHFATPLGLFALEKGARTLLTSSKPQSGGEQSLWIGIDADPGITSWNGFRFYFDWINDPQSYQFREYLPATSWFSSGKDLSVQPGLQDGDCEDSILIYNDSFIRIASPDSWEKGKQTTEAYPFEFEKMFDLRTLQLFKKPLMWVQVKWPATFPPAGFENMTVALNTFPVHNKQLNKITYRLQPGLNGVALPSGDAFLGVHAVVNQKNQIYTPSEKNLYNEDDHVQRIYTLRQQGIGRFDQRNAHAVLYQLMELLRDEVTAFNAIGEDFLASILREIAQNMARIEQKLGVKKASETTAQPFLVIRGQKTPDILFISWWSTISEQANGLPAGTRLQPYSASGISGADVSLLTRTTGGKARPDEMEYVNQLRKNLVTRNRLVTLEDIKAFCSAELGDKLRQVQVKSHFIPGKMAGQGFVRCLQIGLTPSLRAMSDTDWARECELLQLKITKSSTGMYPVQVVTLH